MSTNQIGLALNLARVKIPVAGGTKFFHLWEMSEFRGYAESISGTRGGNSLESWDYLVNAYERWQWLSRIFETKSEYQTSLVAYYMALNIHELATIIDANRQDSLKQNFNSYFIIPLSFLSEDYNTTERAISLLRRNPESLMELWTCLNVTREQIEHAWNDWIESAETELIKYGNFNQKTLPNLSDIFRYLFEGI